MIVQTKKLIPAIYSDSYDMSIFTGLLDLIYTGRELDVLRAKVSHCPQHCFKEDLMHFASLFNLGAEATREVLQNYRLLIKEKGTYEAVKAVIAYSTGCKQDEIKLLVVTTNTGTIATPSFHTCITAYVNIHEERHTLLSVLAQRLLPVNVTLQIRPMEEYPVEKFTVPIYTFTVSDGAQDKSQCGVEEVDFVKYMVKSGTGGSSVSTLNYPIIFDSDKSYNVTVTTNAICAEGGTYTKLYNEKVDIGSTVSLIATVNEGYIFLGWYDGDTKISGDEELTCSVFIGTKSKIFTAKWEKILETT